MGKLCHALPGRNMLPMSTLEWIGIPEPEIGMEISVNVEFLDGRQEEYSFILSGYYTEYIATLIYGPPDGYFSRAFLDSVVEKDEQTMTLLMKQADRIEGSQVEERLYNDITMRDSSQQFIGGDTMAWQAFFSISGGFDTALLLSLVILLSAGLLIYNVLHISFERNVRQYGLLKTLGTTAKQLKNIVFQQVLRTVLWGSLLGGAAGTLIALAILPALLSKMYLYRFGSAAGMISFHPILLLASVLFCSVVTFLSFSLAVRRTVRLTPMEAVHYMGRTDGEAYLRRNSKKRKSPKSSISNWRRWRGGIFCALKKGFLSVRYAWRWGL